ncbi:hypothetical protein [Acinetobacter radioresistens]|uniref:hypothetical protein n=1 Tax=Acinetobacter radioresistens TaxID=40216 RepID=UPI000E74ADBB|nr:hypothetical protein [Acinetobacter radioresistens]RJL68908.1 hypothetical protein D5055_14000 [Acinetobacter radioresistens]
MLRVFILSSLLLGVMSGCATTSKLMNFKSDTPIQQVLEERPELLKDLATVEIRQFFNNIERPTAAQVKVTETGLKDDSVRSVRTIYSFKHIENNWKLVNTQRSYQCMRSKNTKSFQAAQCP